LILPNSAAGQHLAALTLLAVAWIAVRMRLGLSPYHFWLGAACAAIVSILADAFRTQTNIGPLADLLTSAGALLSGYFFSAGVRAEANRGRDHLVPVVVGVALTLGVALILEIGIGDPDLRISVLRFLIALEFASVFLWIPQLLRGSAPKLGTTLLAVLSGLIAVGVLVQTIMTAVLLLAILVLSLFTIQVDGPRRGMVP
jgi:hypothetical protein